MLFRLLAILPASFMLCLAPASAENRIALVIGNSSYKTVTVLPNPANDARLVNEMLRAAQFEVIEEPDLTQAAMRRTIREFADKVTQKGPDTIALIYYAGHGLQVEGENYLVPVDADIKRESDVAIEAVRLNDLMTALGSTPSKTRIVILDACRNNPFSEINKTTGRGLAIVDAPKGSVVSYSTSPGMEALDGQGDNSPFTTALVEIAREPNLQIEQAFKRVRLAVHKSTDGQQTPWESSSLTSDFAFFAAGADAKKDEPKKDEPKADDKKSAAPPAAKPAGYWRKELQPKGAAAAYEVVVREDDVDAYQEFLVLFPGTALAQRVRGLLDRRREMITWYTAVLVNTTLSYQGFLDRYPNSDLAPTARKLRDRQQLRAQSAMARAVPGAGQNQTPQATPVSLPATCSCPAPSRGKEKPQKPTRAASAPPPQPVSEAPPVSIGIGIGGLGGIRRGGGGGGSPSYGGRPQPSYQSPSPSMGSRRSN